MLLLLLPMLLFPLLTCAVAVVVEVSRDNEQQVVYMYYAYLPTLYHCYYYTSLIRSRPQIKYVFRMSRCRWQKKKITDTYIILRLIPYY